jgi:hypothetical protein
MTFKFVPVILLSSTWLVTTVTEVLRSFGKKKTSKYRANINKAHLGKKQQRNDKWEEQFTDFKAQAGIPARDSVI